MSKQHRRLNKRVWERLRKKVFERDGYRCKQCGRASRLEADHIVPLNQGGKPYDLDGLQSLCVECHLHKTQEENSPFLANAVTKRWKQFVHELVT